jgi:translation initiation factor IF-3
LNFYYGCYYLINSLFFGENKVKIFVEVSHINRQANRGRSQDRTLINEAIRAKEVRLLDSEGEQVGIVSRDEALAKAASQDLDLVCISPNASPPVCRIMDYGKYRYEQQQKQKESKKNQKILVTKEIRLSPTIDSHDFETKAKHAEKFLTKGDKVKISIRFRARAITHSNIGKDVLDRFAARLSEFGTVEAKPKLEGRSMHMLLAPIKK